MSLSCQNHYQCNCHIFLKKVTLITKPWVKAAKPLVSITDSESGSAYDLRIFEQLLVLNQVAQGFPVLCLPPLQVMCRRCVEV